MLITRTPFRVSFFGGGTDYYEYFSEYGGSVLSTGIDKYCYVTLRKMPSFFYYKNQLTYSQIERFNDPSELKHPLVRAILEHTGADKIQIAYDADLPACSGLGSSSAFAVGLLQGLHALEGCFPDKMSLAKEAVYIERDFLKEAGGEQDQVAAAFGGFNRIYFSKDGITVRPADVTEETKNQLQKNLLLLFTGFTRYSGEIAVSQKQNIPLKLSQLHEMKALTDTAENILKKGDTDEFGRLLDYTWNLKQTLSEKITNPRIDSLYTSARKHGALGGKLLGSGGGGFLLLYVPEENQELLKNKMPDLNFIKFRFENNGTQIIHNDKK